MLKRWWTRREVAQRYGDRHPMTISRWCNRNHSQYLPEFPQPVDLNGRKFWSDEDLDNYDAQLMGREVAHAS